MSAEAETVDIRFLRMLLTLRWSLPGITEKDTLQLMKRAALVEIQRLQARFSTSELRRVLCHELLHAFASIALEPALLPTLAAGERFVPTAASVAKSWSTWCELCVGALRDVTQLGGLSRPVLEVSDLQGVIKGIEDVLVDKIRNRWSNLQALECIGRRPQVSADAAPLVASSEASSVPGTIASADEPKKKLAEEDPTATQTLPAFSCSNLIVVSSSTDQNGSPSDVGLVTNLTEVPVHEAFFHQQQQQHQQPSALSPHFMPLPLINSVGSIYSMLPLPPPPPPPALFYFCNSSIPPPPLVPLIPLPFFGPPFHGYCPNLPPPPLPPNNYFPAKPVAYSSIGDQDKPETSTSNTAASLHDNLSAAASTVTAASELGNCAPTPKATAASELGYFAPTPKATAASVAEYRTLVPNTSAQDRPTGPISFSTASVQDKPENGEGSKKWLPASAVCLGRKWHGSLAGDSAPPKSNKCYSSVALSANDGTAAAIFQIVDGCLEESELKPD